MPISRPKGHKIDSRPDPPTKLKTKMSAAKFIITMMQENHADDTLVVTPIDEDTYRYVHTQKTINNVTAGIVNYSELSAYINSFMHAIRDDDTPYTNIQIDCPSYPSIVINHANITHRKIGDICDRVYYLQENWPLEACA